MFAFKLQDDNQYKECDYSQGLSGLPIALLEQTLLHLQEASNITVANWSSEQIQSLDIKED